MSDDRRKKKNDRRKKQYGPPGGEEQRLGERRLAREEKGMTAFYIFLWLLIFLVPGGGVGAYYYMHQDKECHFFKPVTMQDRIDGQTFCQNMTKQRAKEFQDKGEDWGYLYIDTKCLGGKLVHECKRYRENTTY